MRELSESEKKFVEAICSYPSPAVEDNPLFVTDLRMISREDPDRREKLDSYHRLKDATREVINSLSNAVNCGGGYKGLEVIEAVKQDKAGYANLVELAYEWVEVISKTDDSSIDARNEQSTKDLREIAALLTDEYGRIGNETRYFACLEESVRGMHRTLKQSASAMLCNVLAEVEKVVEKHNVERKNEMHISYVFY